MLSGRGAFQGTAYITKSGLRQVMTIKLAHEVSIRAGHCCEYCHFPRAFSFTTFEVDHIVPEQHHGPTVLNNLALACFACNHHKGPNLAGIDPKSKQKCWLFNPRKQRWAKHFRWNGPILIGRTNIERATVSTLNINSAYRIQERLALMEEGVFHKPK